MQKYVVANHAPSLLPDGLNFELVWSDEFDGTELDMTKWDYRLSMMGKRHPTWTDEGVSLDGNSNAVFRIYEKDGVVCSSQLQTGYNFMDEPVEWPARGPDNFMRWGIGRLKKSKYLHKYGYYECRCRLQRMNGWWSAFWLQSPVIGCSLDPGEAGIETDIMESFTAGEVSCHANHCGGYGGDLRTAAIGKGAKLDVEEFHTFGVLWTPEGYTFYIDGVEDGRSSDPVSHRPQFILISTEVNGYRRPEYTATEEALAAAAAGDTFLVDHVRVFDVVE